MQLFTIPLYYIAFLHSVLFYNIFLEQCQLDKRLATWLISRIVHTCVEPTVHEHHWCGSNCLNKKDLNFPFTCLNQNAVINYTDIKNIRIFLLQFRQKYKPNKQNKLAALRSYNLKRALFFQIKYALYARSFYRTQTVFNLCRLTKWRSLTLTLSTNQPVSLVAGAGVAAWCVDAHLGGVAVMRVGLTLVNVCKTQKGKSLHK